MTDLQPQLPGTVVVKSEVHDLVERVANDLIGCAIEAVRERGVFHVALSGGSTPEVLFKRIVTDPTYRAWPWADTHFWVVDERVVPIDDDRCNWKMMRAYLIDHLPLPEGHAHPMPTDHPRADEWYEAEVRRLVPAGDDGVPRLDYVMLGMGGDGHTASLFPQTEALDERDRLVVFNDGELVIEPRPRLTMTYPLINAARRVAVLVTGASKQTMLARVAQSDRDVQNLPITGVAPTHGVLTWYLDQAACER